MDADTYAVEAQVEADHWWFVGRRALFAREIEALGLRRQSAVLDIGTSTGTNLRLMRDMGFGDVIGLDFSEEAVRYCASKGLGQVRRGDVCAIPFDNASFDLVLATDIIEHVDDDALALREISRVLRPGGVALLTVPTFQSLWGLQDEVSHHKRRYRLGELVDKVRDAGLSPLRSYYFNYLLFLPIWLARQVIALLGVRLQSENQVNTAALNKLLGAIFHLDVRTAGMVRPPLGVSAMVIAKKKAV
jgi:SAM-dependent methyltransferase